MDVRRHTCSRHTPDRLHIRPSDHPAHVRECEWFGFFPTTRATDRRQRGVQGIQRSPFLHPRSMSARGALGGDSLYHGRIPHRDRILIRFPREPSHRRTPVTPRSCTPDFGAVRPGRHHTGRLRATHLGQAARTRVPLPRRYHTSRNHSTSALVTHNRDVAVPTPDLHYNMHGERTRL